ncbi:MAG: hypothetical protein QOF48_1513 [Verrucomicrobiota bacterium]|jgi:hypothetical protein
MAFPLLTEAQTYTAAQFAYVLKSTKGEVLQFLGEPKATLYIHDPHAKRWTVSALSQEWQEQLALEARRAKLVDAGQLMIARTETWQPRNRAGEAVSIVDMKTGWIERALTLRDNLVELLEWRHELSPSEFREELGAKKLRSGRLNTGLNYGDCDLAPLQRRRLVHRVVNRDRGSEHFERLEIYLDERAFIDVVPGETTS